MTTEQLSGWAEKVETLGDDALAAEIREAALALGLAAARARRALREPRPQDPGEED